MTTARADLPTIRMRRGPEAATVVRAAARTVLTIGVLIAGSVVYQFGVTNSLAARAQSGLEQDLEARFASVDAVRVPFEVGDLPQEPFVAAAVPVFDPASCPDSTRRRSNRS